MQGSRFGAWIEGVCLISTLGLLLSVLLIAKPSVDEIGDDGEPVGREPVSRFRTSSPPPTHLIVLVDHWEGRAGISLAREVEAGMDDVVSVEVVEATETALIGLEEAMTAAAAPCASDCVQLAVLDLRVKPAR